MKALLSTGTVRILAALLVLAVGMILGPQAAQAFTVGPSVDFANPLNYDNTANTVTAGPVTHNNQTFGLMRDVFWWGGAYGNSTGIGSPDFINTGFSLIQSGGSPSHAIVGPGPYTALNFTGLRIPNGGQTFLSIYDNLAVPGHDLFNASVAGGLTIFADVLFANPGHQSTGGVVSLYNEGQAGLALLAYQGGGNNHDFVNLSLIGQSAGHGTSLASVDLPATTFDAAEWYRVTMNLTVAGDTWTMNGSFFNHSDPTNPNSGLGALITNLNFSGSLSDPDASTWVLSNPGEIGLMAGSTAGYSDGLRNPGGTGANPLNDNIGVSIYCFNGCTPVVPEPASLLLLGSGLVGLAAWRRRRRNA